MPRVVVRTAAVLALTLAFTAACVQESGRRGRLASTPNYDDCVYCLDGALLRNAVVNDGVAGGWSLFEERAHHSPFSALLASAAFVLLGQHEPSPYWMNGLVVLLYLAGVGYLLWPLPTPSWLLALGIFLTPPFITMGVVEFRPDIAWAEVSGFGVVWMVTREQMFRVPARAAFAGGCIADQADDVRADDAALQRCGRVTRHPATSVAADDTGRCGGAAGQSRVRVAGLRRSRAPGIRGL